MPAPPSSPCCCRRRATPRPPIVFWGQDPGALGAVVDQLAELPEGTLELVPAGLPRRRGALDRHLRPPAGDGLLHRARRRGRDARQHHRADRRALPRPRRLGADQRLVPAPRHRPARDPRRGGDPRLARGDDRQRAGGVQQQHRHRPGRRRRRGRHRADQQLLPAALPRQRPGVPGPRRPLRGRRHRQPARGGGDRHHLRLRRIRRGGAVRRVPALAAGAAVFRRLGLRVPRDPDRDPARRPADARFAEHQRARRSTSTTSPTSRARSSCCARSASCDRRGGPPPPPAGGPDPPPGPGAGRRGHDGRAARLPGAARARSRRRHGLGAAAAAHAPAPVNTAALAAGVLASPPRSRCRSPGSPPAPTSPSAARSTCSPCCRSRCRAT
jgi:hypothetical protein